MFKVDKNALICDLAETYHIYDYKSLPLSTIAILAGGLPQNSRTKMKLANTSVPIDTMLLASIFDRLNMFMYSMTKDARSRRNQPKSLVKLLLGEGEGANQGNVFVSGKDFDKARQAMIKRIEEGGN